MKIDQFVDEFNHLEQKDKAVYIANLQKKAGNGVKCTPKVGHNF